MADDNFIGVREHHEAIASIKDEQAKLREKTAGLEMSLLHQMAGMQRSLDHITTLLQRPQVDHSALATHRAIETLPQTLAEAMRQARGTNQSPVLIAFALLGAVALGAFGMQFIGG
jgi:hypothetical protein